METAVHCPLCMTVRRVWTGALSYRLLQRKVPCWVTEIVTQITNKKLRIYGTSYLSDLSIYLSIDYWLLISCDRTDRTLSHRSQIGLSCTRPLSQNQPFSPLWTCLRPCDYWLLIGLSCTRPLLQNRPLSPLWTCLRPCDYWLLIRLSHTRPLSHLRSHLSQGFHSLFCTDHRSDSLAQIGLSCTQPQTSSEANFVREAVIDYWLLICAREADLCEKGLIGWERSHEKVREAVCERVREINKFRWKLDSLTKSASLASRTLSHSNLIDFSHLYDLIDYWLLISDWIRQICQRVRDAREADLLKFLTFDSNSTSDLKNQTC